MFETNHFNEAISPFNKSVKYMEDVSDSFKCEILKLLGKSCYNIGRINDSVKSLVECTKYCKNESNEIKSDVYQSLGKAYRKHVYILYIIFMCYIWYRAMIKKLNIRLMKRLNTKTR